MFPTLLAVPPQAPLSKAPDPRTAGPQPSESFAGALGRAKRTEEAPKVRTPERNDRRNRAHEDPANPTEPAPESVAPTDTDPPAAKSDPNPDHVDADIDPRAAPPKDTDPSSAAPPDHAGEAPVGEGPTPPAQATPPTPTHIGATPVPVPTPSQRAGSTDAAPPRTTDPQGAIGEAPIDGDAPNPDDTAKASPDDPTRLPPGERWRRYRPDHLGNADRENVNHTEIPRRIPEWARTPEGDSGDAQASDNRGTLPSVPLRESTDASAERPVAPQSPWARQAGAESAPATDAQAPRAASDTGSDTNADARRDPAPSNAPVHQAKQAPPASAAAPTVAPADPTPTKLVPDQVDTSPTLRAPGAHRIGVASAQTAEHADRPAPPQGYENAVTRGMSAVLRQNGGSVVIRLIPETLGPLRISMTLDQSTVSVRLDAATAQAHELLSSNLASLRQSLESQGLRVDRMGVTLAPSHHAPSATPTDATAHQRGSEDPGAGNQDAAHGRSRGHADQDPRDRRGGDHADPSTSFESFSELFDSGSTTVHFAATA